MMFDKWCLLIYQVEDDKVYIEYIDERQGYQ